MRGYSASRLLLVVALFPACPRHGGPAAASTGERCVVASVTDGDTIRCTSGTRVRLIGIDSPEMTQGRYGGRARAALFGIIPNGSRVTLERDVDLTDRYGRRLAYVWRDTQLVNEIMVREGFAMLLTYPPNVKYVERLRAAEQEARDARAGLWGEDGFACLPVEFRRGACKTLR